jgi:hypothetical protein
LPSTTRYFFHVFNGEWRPDENGAEFADVEAARTYGRELVSNIIVAGTLLEACLGAHKLIVDNEHGDRITSLRIEERHS